MGNCFRKNKVEPLVVKDDAAKMLERGTPDNRPAKNKHVDMVESLREEGQTANVAKDGLSFVVDFTPCSKKGKKGMKPPNIGKKASSGNTAQDPDLPDYTLEEKALIAEILREEQLKEKKEKARNVDMKVYDAKRRRMMYEAEAEALRKERELSGVVKRGDGSSVSQDGVVERTT